MWLIHIGQPECRTPWLEKVLSDNTGLGQWVSNSVALWNRLENFKKKKKMLSSTPRYSDFVGMNVVWAQTSLKAPQVILTCSQVLEPLVEKNTFSSMVSGTIYPWRYKFPSLRSMKQEKMDSRYLTFGFLSGR